MSSVQKHGMNIERMSMYTKLITHSNASAIFKTNLVMQAYEKTLISNVSWHRIFDISFKPYKNHNPVDQRKHLRGGMCL